MTHTDKLTVVANAFVTKFQTNANLGINNPLKALTADVDGIVPEIKSSDIYYGDQSKFPRVPSLCVEPSNKNRDLEGAAHTGMTRNSLLVFFLLYFAGPEDQTVRKQTDELGEAIETLVHQDLQLNNGVPGADLIIHGYCTAFESGYTYRANTLYRSVRITWTGTTKTRLS